MIMPQPLGVATLFGLFASAFFPISPPPSRMEAVPLTPSSAAVFPTWASKRLIWLMPCGDRQSVMAVRTTHSDSAVPPSLFAIGSHTSCLLSNTPT